MDEAVRLENISMMNACDDAELRLRILRNNATQAQKQNEPNFLHLAHAALEDIWHLVQNSTYPDCHSKRVEYMPPERQ